MVFCTSSTSNTSYIKCMIDKIHQNDYNTLSRSGLNNITQEHFSVHFCVHHYGCVLGIYKDTLWTKI